MKRLVDGIVRALVVVGALTATGASAQGITLTIATHYTDEQRGPLTGCLREYERLNPGTAIVHRQLSYRDFLQTLFMSRMSGKPPDIYNLSTAWTAQLVESGALAVPPAAVTDFVVGNYLANTSETMTANGHVWGIPAEVDVYMLIYNKILFARAGIAKPPTNADEFVKDAASISKSNRQGQLTTAGFGFGPSPDQVVAPFLTLLNSNGGSLFSPDRKSTNLTSATARDALETEVRLFTTKGTSRGAAPNQFSSGSLGMMIVPNWYQKQLHQELGEHFDETVGVAPIPGGMNWRTVQYGFFWAVDATSQHPAEAWALLKWLNTARTPGGRSCVGDMLLDLGALTGNKDDLAASAADIGNPFMRPFVDALSSGRALPEVSIPHANEIKDLLSNYTERALLGMLSPEQALSEADNGIRLILRESE
ncbi:MAG: extracellular solute-binding protein [Acidobacteriaceae bacterium]